MAQNKIEKLPSPHNGNYNCPVLEELYLQDNSLEEILPEIFRLPSLVTLDISNNKIQKMPFEMWKAPKLRELNIAFNLLKDLPTSQDVSSVGEVRIKVILITMMIFSFNCRSIPQHRCLSIHQWIRRGWPIARRMLSQIWHSKQFLHFNHFTGKTNSFIRTSGRSRWKSSTEMPTNFSICAVRRRCEI